MRTSLVLLALLAACSDASAPRQVPVLTTELSSSVSSVQGLVTVTLKASNPTDTTLHLSFTTPPISLMIHFSNGDAPAGGGPRQGYAELETLSLAPHAAAALGLVTMSFVPSSQRDVEYWPISTGSYVIQACYYPSSVPLVGHDLLMPVCGSSVPLTLTP